MDAKEDGSAAAAAGVADIVGAGYAGDDYDYDMVSAEGIGIGKLGSVRRDDALRDCSSERDWLHCFRLDKIDLGSVMGGIAVAVVVHTGIAGYGHTNDGLAIVAKHQNATADADSGDFVAVGNFRRLKEDGSEGVAAAADRNGKDSNRNVARFQLDLSLESFLLPLAFPV